MKVQAYLNFNGRCEEALEFYRHAVGAEIEMMMRMKESPEPHPDGLPDAMQNKIMHASFLVGDTMIMASDGRCTSATAFEGISLALSVANDAEAARRFAALAEGGQVHQPLVKTFFSSSFGVLADRFGVSWMVLVDT